MSRITLQMIADEAGLSKFAVSRALAGKTGVSDATRVRVAAVADRLGYRRIPTSAQRRMGVIFNDSDIINSELHMQIQSGVQREAARLDIDARIYWTHDPDDLEVIARDCDLLLICGPHDRDAITRLRATGIPIVRQGWLDPLEPVDQIGGTDREAGSAVAAYLLGLGHREIAYVHGDPSYRGRMERLYGLREVLEAEPGTTLHDLTWEDDAGFAAAFDRLRAGGARPTAYFCAHDGLAVTVMSELLARGTRIPEDASVVGFGGFSAALQILPRLTTVETPGAGIGAMAVQLLHGRTSQPGLPSMPLRIFVAARIIERQSVGPASRTAPLVSVAAVS